MGPLSYTLSFGQLIVSELPAKKKLGTFALAVAVNSTPLTSRQAAVVHDENNPRPSKLFNAASS